MNDSEALVSLLKHEVDVLACESNGTQQVKVELRSGEVFVGKSFESLLDQVIDQFGSRVPCKPSEKCMSLELAIEDWKLDRLQMQQAAPQSPKVKKSKKKA